MVMCESQSYLWSGTREGNSESSSDVEVSRGDVTEECEETHVSDEYEENERIKTNPTAAVDTTESHFDARGAWARLKSAFESGADVQLSTGDQVLAAIGYAQLHDYEEWQTGVFNFARVLRGCPSFEGRDCRTALAIAEEVFASWDYCEGPNDERAAAVWWKELDVLREDAIIEFLDGWEKARCTPVRGPWQSAVEMAKQNPLEFSAECLGFDTAGYRAFLTFAGWLQVSIGPAEIWLPVRDVARLLKVSTMTISRYRRRAIEDGFLQITAEAKQRKHEATRFVFDVRRVPILRDRAHTSIVDLAAEHFD